MYYRVMKKLKLDFVFCLFTANDLKGQKYPCDDNNVKKRVVSHTIDEIMNWNCTFLEGNLAAPINKLCVSFDPTIFLEML